MDDLVLLSDDHALLLSQVKHVMALAQAYGEQHIDGAPLREETQRQSNELRSQLEAHFAFEETSIFPQLQADFPFSVPRIQQLITSHELVLGAFEEYLAELNLGQATDPDKRELLSSVIAFEQKFQQHVKAETELFQEMASCYLQLPARSPGTVTTGSTDPSMSSQFGGFQSSILDAVRKAIEQQIPDAKAEVAGAGGHFQIEVVSPAFAGKSPLESQRLVYSAIRHLMSGDAAPVHAVDSLRTRTPER